MDDNRLCHCYVASLSSIEMHAMQMCHLDLAVFLLVRFIRSANMTKCCRPHTRNSVCTAGGVTCSSSATNVNEQGQSNCVYSINLIKKETCSTMQKCCTCTEQLHIAHEELFAKTVKQHACHTLCQLGTRIADLYACPCLHF